MPLVRPGQLSTSAYIDYRYLDSYLYLGAHTLLGSHFSFHPLQPGARKMLSKHFRVSDFLSLLMQASRATSWVLRTLRRRQL